MIACFLLGPSENPPYPIFDSFKARKTNREYSNVLHFMITLTAALFVVFHYEINIAKRCRQKIPLTMPPKGQMK